MVGDGHSIDAKTYTLATNDYMARGGDGYTVFAGAKNLIDPIDAQLMASQVIDYVAAEGTVSPKVEGESRRCSPRSHQFSHAEAAVLGWRLSYWLPLDSRKRRN